MRAKNIIGLSCYLLATLFLGYEMALQVSPAVMVHELIRDIGLNAQSLSFISAAYFCAYASMQIPAGILFDKFNAKIILTTAAGICTFGIYLFVLTKSPLLLALGRFITGFGSAFAFVGVLVMANQWFASKYFAILVGIAQLIAALGAMFGEVPLALSVDAHGWQNAVVGLTFIGIVLTMLIALIIRNNTDTSTKVPNTNLYHDLLSVLKNKQNWVIALYAFACWGPVTSFAELWGVEFIRQNLDTSKHLAASVASSIWLGIAVGAPIIGYTATKLGRYRDILRVTSIIGCIATLALIYGPLYSLLHAHILAFFFGIAAASQILTFSMIKKHTPKHLIGTAIGFMNMAVVAGGAILQPIVGLIIHYSWDGFMKNGSPWYSANDYQQALLIIPICYFICSVISLYGIKED